MLKVDNIKVSYGRVEALHGVSIGVEKGEVVTIIGSNGAGKSTLLRAICGVLIPTAGKIEASAGRDIALDDAPGALA